MRPWAMPCAALKWHRYPSRPFHTGKDMSLGQTVKQLSYCKPIAHLAVHILCSQHRRHILSPMSGLTNMPEAVEEAHFFQTAPGNALLPAHTHEADAG